MDTAIVVALIALATSIIVTALSAYLSKMSEIKVEWQRKKIVHYQKLLTAMSDMAMQGRDQVDAKTRFSEAVNTITLIAGQPVIAALMELCDFIMISNHSKTQERHNELIRNLMLEIRKDIGLIKNDDEHSFDFRFVQP